MTERTEDAKLVVALVDAFTDVYPEEMYRAAHIVVEDLNLEDHHIDSVLIENTSPAHTVAFLRFLKTMPVSWRSSEAVFGHDEEN